MHHGVLHAGRGSRPSALGHGLICRLDDRADPIVQLAPPLVAEAALFDEIAEILADALTHAWERARELPSMAAVETA